MINPNFRSTFSVSQSPEEAVNAIKNPRGWWSQAIEWTGTKLIFEIARKGNATEVRFTHEGLVPDYECYGICSNAWGTYINGSLRRLIATGKGDPNPKEE